MVPFGMANSGISVSAGLILSEMIRVNNVVVNRQLSGDRNRRFCVV